MGDDLAAPAERLSIRQRRAMSAIARPNSSLLRQASSTTTKPRRPYSAYSQRGAEESMERYQPPETNREWWRYSVKETPNPGSYDIKSFVHELDKKPSSYRFRDSSRAKSASHTRFQRTGEVLLPGAYDISDSIDEVAKKPSTYSFKNTDRYQGPKIGHGYGDKDIDVSPASFNLAQDLCNKGDMLAIFKSQVERTPGFRIPEKGPGPGQYESMIPQKGSAMTSVFRSKIPRFQDKPSKVPPPGSYFYQDSVFGAARPLSAVHQHLQKRHGLGP